MDAAVNVEARNSLLKGLSSNITAHLAPSAHESGLLCATDVLINISPVDLCEILSIEVTPLEPPAREKFAIPKTKKKKKARTRPKLHKGERTTSGRQKRAAKPN